MADIHDYLIDQEGQDWGALLADWDWLLPEEFTLWLVNRFGDLFLVLEDDSVHRLDVGAGTLERVARDREDFANRIDDPAQANVWLLIPLVDACVEAGLVPGPGRCYGYRLLPVLGGDFSPSNTVVRDLADHYAECGQVHDRIRDLEDGTDVRLRVGEEE